jgi:hypothetical protein
LIASKKAIEEKYGNNTYTPFNSGSCAKNPVAYHFKKRTKPTIEPKNS